MAGPTDWKAGLSGLNAADLASRTNNFGEPYAQQFIDAWTAYVNGLSGPGGGGTGPTTYGTYGGVKLAGSSSTNPAIAMYKQLWGDYTSKAKQASEQARLGSGWTKVGKRLIAPDNSRGEVSTGRLWGPYASADAWKHQKNMYGQPVNYSGPPNAQGSSGGYRPPTAPTGPRPPTGGGGSVPGGPGVPPSSPQYVGMPASQNVQMRQQGAPAWWQAFMDNRPSLQQAQAAALRGSGGQ